MLTHEAGQVCKKKKKKRGQKHMAVTKVFIFFAGIGIATEGYGAPSRLYSGVGHVGSNGQW